MARWLSVIFLVLCLLGKRHLDDSAKKPKVCWQTVSAKWLHSFWTKYTNLNQLVNRRLKVSICTELARWSSIFWPKTIWSKDIWMTTSRNQKCVSRPYWQNGSIHFGQKTPVSAQKIGQQDTKSFYMC